LACKHGIIGLTQSAALEYVDSHIRINSVCPGIIQTPGLDRTFSRVPGFSFEDVKQWGLSQIPMKRFGQAEEVAAAVLWLCSDGASYLTGHSLIVDGGSHCKRYYLNLAYESLRLVQNDKNEHPPVKKYENFSCNLICIPVYTSIALHTVTNPIDVFNPFRLNIILNSSLLSNILIH